MNKPKLTRKVHVDRLTLIVTVNEGEDVRTYQFRDIQTAQLFKKMVK